jgi:chromosome segregation ATPase
MAITRDQVFETAEALKAEGMEPQYILIRSRIGSGSFSTIQKYLKEWRELSTQVPIQVEQNEEVPEGFKTVFDRAALEAWRTAVAWANQEIEDHQELFERRLQEATDEIAQAANTIDELQENLITVTQERDSLKEETENARDELSKANGIIQELRQRLADTEERSEQLRQSLDTMTNDRNNLKLRLDEMQESLNQSETLILQFQEQIRSTEKEASEQQRRAEIAEAEATRLVESLDASNKDRERLRSELDTTIPKLAKAEGALEEDLAEKRIEHLEKQQIELQDQIKILVSKLSNEPAENISNPETNDPPETK